MLLRGVGLACSTRDLDFVVAVETLRPDLEEALVQAGLCPAPRISQRLSCSDDRAEVDVLPLDAAAFSTGRIEFPEGGSIPSLGLREVIRQASAVPSGPCTARVAELPILVAPKLVAGSGRLEERDLRDAVAAMEQDAAEGNRRYLEVDYITAGKLSLETAGAFLIARDLGGMGEDRTAEALQEVVGALRADVQVSEGRELGVRYAPLLRAFEMGPEPPAVDPKATGRGGPVL